MSNKKYHGKFNNRSQKHRSAKPISKQSGSTQSFTKLKFDSNLLNISYEDAKARLQALLQEKAVFEYDSVLPSGRITSHYLDTKETLLSSYGAFLASVCILHNLKDEVEFVGGALMQAYPLSQAICQLALVRGQELDSFMVRESSAARRKGLSKWIEGPLRPGAKVCIVHDEVIDGTKVIEAIRMLQDEADAQIVQVIGVVDRMDGARSRLQDYGVDFTSIVNMDELVREDALI